MCALQVMHPTIYLADAFVGDTPQAIVNAVQGLTADANTTVTCTIQATDPASKSDEKEGAMDSTNSPWTLQSAFGSDS